MAAEADPSLMQPLSPCPPRHDEADWVSGQDGGAFTRPISSRELLLGRSSVTIDHEGTQYVLRATRAGKLILTK